MWEKIAKEMQLPWRAAEAMHWQIGEIEMAHRANVSVFHLAGQQGSNSSQGMGSDGGASTSPTSAIHPTPSSTMTISHTHNHSLPQIPPNTLPHPLSPVDHFRRNSVGSMSPNGMGPGYLRRRADSTRSVASVLPRAHLPPLDEVASMSARDPRPKYPPGPW
jgi:hypothetical protein